MRPPATWRSWTCSRPRCSPTSPRSRPPPSAPNEREPGPRHGRGAFIPRQSEPGQAPVALSDGADQKNRATDLWRRHYVPSEGERRRHPPIGDASNGLHILRDVLHEDVTATHAQLPDQVSAVRTYGYVALQAGDLPPPRCTMISAEPAESRVASRVRARRLRLRAGKDEAD